MSLPNNIAVILNTSSGFGTKDEKISHLKEAFSKNSLSPEFFLVNLAEEIKERTRQALAQGFTTIVAAGGDGTISAVASVLAGKSAVLGVLPVGTLNHFAQDLNIPQNYAEASKIIARGHVDFVDMGEVNGHLFLNNSSIGLYPRIVHYRNEQVKKGWHKRAALFWAALRALKNYTFLIVDLNFEGKEVLRKTPFVFVGNNKYEIEGWGFGGRKALNRAALSIFLAHRPSRRDLFFMALKSLAGRLRSHSAFDGFESKELSIKTQKNFLQVSVDGEIKVLRTPLNYKILPKILKVLVP